jgi:3-oxo-5-alpha-steroid 4-dehydrogenase 1
MISSSVIQYIAMGWIAAAIIIFPFLLRITAPYGRHSKTNWGPMIDNRLGWILMELPSLLIFVLLVLLGPKHLSSPIWVLFSLWIIHYFNRSVIFPLRTKTIGKKMPVLIVLLAVFFNLINAGLNGYWLGFSAPEYPANWMSDPRFILGGVIFIAGFMINQAADKKLISLRKGGKTGYFIPKGGLFNYISCPNFFGEIIEWSGFAIMAWNLPALSFAVWTAVNLIPRALDHHKWYKSYFKEEYPKQRKAVIPFLL